MPECPQCGGETEEGSRFCRHCGGSLLREEDEAPPPSLYPPPPEGGPWAVYPDPVVRRTRLLGWIWSIYTVFLLVVVIAALILSAVGLPIFLRAPDDEVWRGFEKYVDSIDMPAEKRQETDEFLEMLKSQPRESKLMIGLSLIFSLGFCAVYLGLRLYASYLLIKLDPWGFRLMFIFAILAIVLDFFRVLLPFGLLIGAPTLFLIRFNGPRLGVGRTA